MLSFAAISVREDITRCSLSLFRQAAVGYSSQHNGELIRKIKKKKSLKNYGLNPSDIFGQDTFGTESASLR